MSAYARSIGESLSMECIVLCENATASVIHAAATAGAATPRGDGGKVGVVAEVDRRRNDAPAGSASPAVPLRKSRSDASFSYGRLWVWPRCSTHW